MDLDGNVVLHKKTAVAVVGLSQRDAVVVHRNNGGSRIRTYEALASLAVFKTAAFDRSAIPPTIFPYS